MSNKASGLVWDLECPAKVNGFQFRPNHKYILAAYADHADHNGKSIFPSVGLICKKTGLDDRTVQRLTRDLEGMGYLIEDGQGPRGTNRWRLPYSQDGTKLTPVTVTPVTVTDVTEDPPSGDIPSGDIPSGVTVTDELKNPLTLLNDSINEEVFTPPDSISPDASKVWARAKDLFKEDMRKTNFFESYVEETIGVELEEDCITVWAPKVSAQAWLEDRLKSQAERALVGILARSVSVQFITGGASD